MRILFSSLLTLTTLVASFATESAIVPDVSPTEAYPGGKASVSFKPFASFMLPAANLPDDEKPAFYAGKALGHQPWVKAPTITTARDGLGPVYNARTCLACHVNGGRGVMPETGEQNLVSAFLRLSIPGKDKISGVVPEPTYGDQLQSQSVALFHQLRHMKMKKNDYEAAPEGYAYVDWVSKTFTYPDQSSVELRSPSVRVENLGYGELHPKTMMSLRNAPPLHGMGLLELIPQQDIDAGADPMDKNGDGISGRVNRVWNVETGAAEPGRFGLKANRATIKIITASAFQGDIGITNPLFPDQPCSANQTTCQNTRDGNDLPEDVELPEELLEMVTHFMLNIGVPKRREPNDPDVINGRAAFYETGCAQCHTPSFTTGYSPELPHLSKQTIWPYSDLLLHDMGPDLADHRPDYEATGTEWRTPPLWGVGLSGAVNGGSNLLHDGRARSVEEAILWHGGEAATTKERFIHLPKSERESLIKFVESL
jgi:CxxC motif-containing protein (DUF1111 family)